MIDLRNKKLRRYPGEAILLGIASGIGHYLEVDPVFVRLGWLLLAVLTKVWPAVVLYVILFFIMPIDPSQESVQSHQAPRDVTPTKSESSEKPEPVTMERMDQDQNM